MSKIIASQSHERWPTKDEHDDLEQIAQKRNWGLSLLLVGWLHLLAFLFCHFLTVVQNYHESAGYVAVWLAEVFGIWLIFRICAGSRAADPKPQPLELFVRRVWITYFILAFNLGSMNVLRGHDLFEFFPATASLASFAFVMMGLAVSWRFFGAVLVMFASGLLMAANLLHAYLIFAFAWWFVLNCIGLVLWFRMKPMSSVTRELQRTLGTVPEQPHEPRNSTATFTQALLKFREAIRLRERSRDEP